MSQVAQVHIHSCLSQGFLPITPQKAFGQKSAVVFENQMFASALDENYELWTSLPENGSNAGCVLQRTGCLSATAEYLVTADKEVLMFISVQGEARVLRHLENVKGKEMPDFQSLKIPAPSSGGVIRKIIPAEYTLDGGSEILLAVFFETKEGYGITLAYWDREDALYCSPTSMVAKTLNGFWHMACPGGEDVVEFCILDKSGKKLQCSDSENIKAIDLPQGARDAAWYTRDGQKNAIILGEDNRVYRVTENNMNGENGSEGTLSALFADEGTDRQICPFDEIRLQDDGQILHFWGLSGSALYHFADLQEKQNSPDQALVVEQKVESFHTCSGAKGAGHVLAAHSLDGSDVAADAGMGMTLYQISEKGAVVNQSVSVDSAEASISIDCYTTEITLRDENGAAVQGCNVELKAGQTSTLYVGDRQYVLSPDTPVSLATNAMGKLTIRQPQEDLAGTDFYFRIEGETDYYEVKPDSQVIENIKNIKADTLLNQKLDDGTMLLDGTKPEADRKKMAENVEQAVSSMMSQINTQENMLSARPDDRLDAASRRFARLCSQSPEELALIQPSIDMGRFYVVFSEEHGLSVEKITSDERMMEIREQVFARIGATQVQVVENNIFKKIREFLRSVGKGFVKLTKMIVDAAKTTFTYILDGIERVIEFVVNTIKEVAHCVCEVFHAIAVTFKRLIQWLGILFDWKDIKRTKEYLEKRFDDFLSNLDILDSLQDYVKNIFDSKDKLKEELNKLLDGLKLPEDIDCNEEWKKVDGDKEQSERRDHAESSNLVLQKMQEPGVQQQCMLYFSLENNKAFNDLSDEIEELVEKLKELEMPTEALSQLEGDLQTLVSSKGNLNNLVNALVDLLKVILDLILEFAVDVLEIIWSAVRKVMSYLMELFSQPLYIPVLSSLLKLCGVELPSIKDIFWYMIAIPSTVLYKLLYNEAPVQDGQNLLTDEAGDRLFAMVQFIDCIVYFVSNDLACFLEPDNMVESSKENKEAENDIDVHFFNVVAIAAGLAWLDIDYRRTIKKSPAPLRSFTKLRYICIILGLCCKIAFVRRQPALLTLQIMLELITAIGYAASSFIDYVKNPFPKENSSFKVFANIFSGVHGTVLVGRFLEGGAGKAFVGMAAFIALIAIPFEGAADFT